ncbi:MAG: glycosyltransferase [Dysgonamonadaceae bacterium]|jgi:glycosyltransferase involved in cell wall biosynthesis|nr:glycosyltransferase [Dysgonamonadaceae bacterium]
MQNNIANQSEQSPFFSIIIPTYNSAKTLKDCLDSIVCQKFSDFEILVMDALSNDDTLKIAKNYNNPQIIIFSEKDEGIYDAMNKGITYSKGKWIYFLGSDDSLYNENILQTIYNYVIIRNIDVVYGNVVSSIFNGKYDGPFDYVKIYKKNICHQSIFFKKTLFDQTGYFNLKYKILADHDHNLKWFLNKNYNVEYIDEVIANYGSEGCSSTPSSKYDIFNKDKNYNYILYGYEYLPKLYLLKRCIKEIKSHKKSSSLKRKFKAFMIVLTVLFRV